MIEPNDFEEELEIIGKKFSRNLEESWIKTLGSATAAAGLKLSDKDKAAEIYKIYSTLFDYLLGTCVGIVGACVTADPEIEESIVLSIRERFAFVREKLKKHKEEGDLK